MGIPGKLVKRIAAKLEQSERTVSRRINDRIQEGGGTYSRKVAALSIYADLGYDPKDFASKEEIEELRALQLHLKTKPIVPAKSTIIPIGTQRSKKHQHILRSKVGDAPLNLSPTDMKNADRMTEAYYHLYILENSLRLFISSVLSEQYGEDWWDRIKLRKATLEKGESRTKKDQGNRWIGARGLHPIYYIDFDDYKAILLNHWKFFEIYFSEVERPSDWVLNIIGEITLARNNIAHTGFLTDDDIQRVQLNLRAWLRQISK